LLTLNYRDSRPLYGQIKDGLRRLIITGAIAPDEKLPSVRSLAMDLAINPNTIQRSYTELEAEGFIYSVPGKGCFAAQSAGGGEARKAELMETFRQLLQELRYLSVTDAEIIALVKEGYAL